ncbi:MAG: FeoB-associated Cys-rich membrane protein [Flavobacteriales bacterium]|nr:FeoB-associated Cys-rich membrane protein [Flavobacteriales bacterium]
MNWQEIIVGILTALAVLYLVRYFYKQTQSHQCDDCGLMDMKKKGLFKKLK